MNSGNIFSPVGFRLVDCTRDEHAADILAILNHTIVNSTALYDYHPRSPEMMEAWFSAKQEAGFPVVGVVDAAGVLAGFATWGTFRMFPAYQYTVEHSVYIKPGYHGQGLGTLLLQELIRRAALARLHVLVGCVDTANEASVRLHQRLGFTHAGRLKEVGYKFGRWLDTDFYQLILDTPDNPQEN